MIPDKDRNPALHQLLTEPVLPFECCDCPFATPTYEGSDPTEDRPNLYDPGEGYYDCSLLERNRIWGETPACGLATWQKRACEELSTQLGSEGAR